MSSENQRKAAKAALKKIADAISENEGRMRILQKGEDAATKKASNTSNEWREHDSRYRRMVEQAEQKEPHLPTATQRYGRNSTNVSAHGQADDYHRALAWEHNNRSIGNWGEKKEIQDIRNRGEKITLRRKGIEAKNESLKEEASNIAMTERQHVEKVISDMRARAKKGISTEYADNLMIQGRGTPPADFVPRTTQQEGNLVAKTIGAAGAAGTAGYWTRKKESDRAGQK
jgi:hypothetical protein